MANQARGEVRLDLGEATYVLRPTFAAVCEIEDALQANLFEIGRRLEQAEVTARELVDVAHACITHSGQEVARERLGELIVAHGTHKTVAALVQFCRNYAFGGDQEKKADAPAPQDRSRTRASTCAPT